ncbi:MAG: PH domain-containing protein [Lysobacterales bacterium]
MTFSNLALDLDSLPQAQDLELKNLDPRYPKEVRTQHAITWAVLTLIAAIPVIIVIKPPGLRSFLWLLPTLLAVLGIAFTTLATNMAKAKKMALRDHDIIFLSGIWWKKTVMLPRNRVQHIELSSGPLQRKFGLASLKFYTAGGAAVDLQIDGLSRDQAKDLRDHVMQQHQR